MNLWIKTVLIIIFVNMGYLHPVHVSITNIEYNQDQNELSVSFKVFTDDIQLLFAHLYQLKIDFSEKGNFELYKEKINQYFNKHFKLTGQHAVYNLLPEGFKMNDDSIWFYYKIKDVKSIHSIHIVNTVFLDLYLDQKNLMIIKVGEKEKAYRFDYKKTEHLMEFE